jgi:hypothetical protein
MGLSNEERFSGIVWSLHHFEDILSDLKRQHYLPLEYDRLIELLDELWPAFLSKQGNSAYWILGSDQLSAEVTPGNLLGVALLAAKNFHQLDEDEIEKMEWQLERTNGQTILNYLTKFKPEIIKILGGHPSAIVLRAFFQVEAAFYYLNRYEDDFSKGCEELAKVLAKIWGATFRILQEDENLLTAYCIHNLLEIVLPYRDDLVSQWWKKHNLHHDARVGAIEPAEVLKLWKEYQPKRLEDVSEEERILITLKILGSRFHYSHQHKELLKMIRVENKKRKKSERVRLKYIEETLKKCAKDYESAKKREQNKQSRYCWLTDNDWEE